VLSGREESIAVVGVEEQSALSIQPKRAHKSEIDNPKSEIFRGALGGEGLFAGEAELAEC
jgi:hypothetical protein